MQNSNTLYLTKSEAPYVDYELASRIIKPSPGRLWVLEWPNPERIGSIYVSDGAATSLKGDSCTVLAAGLGVDLSPGDTVLVSPTHGTWIEDGVFGSYRAEGRIRIYGMAWYLNDPHPQKWDDSCPVKIVKEFRNTTHGGYSDFETEHMQALGTKLIIKRDPIVESQSGILLSDNGRYRECTATVVSAGKKAMWHDSRVIPGVRVHYDPQGLLDTAFGDDPDLAIIDVQAVNAVIV